MVQASSINLSASTSLGIVLNVIKMSSNELLSSSFSIDFKEAEAGEEGRGVRECNLKRRRDGKR
jgi:hypothetical protein